jgi:glutamine amidotransferase
MLTVVVDVGLGNLRSVEKAIETAASGRCQVLRSARLEDVVRADRLVVPGQGGFRDCSAAFASGLGEAIVERIRAGVPYLGICLGLQVLFESSEESPGAPGLAVFPGRVERIAAEPGLKIPHMGWNALEQPPSATGALHPHLAAAGGVGTAFYFVHSYHAVPKDPALLAGVVRYGSNVVTAAIARDNVFATQFHPEKSQRAGLRLLDAFLSA